MADVTIRPALRADLPAVGQLGAHLLRVHYEFDRGRFMRPGEDSEEGYSWFLGSQLQAADVLVLVAELDGAVIGYLYAGIEPRSWKELRDEAGFIHDIVVTEKARGKRVADRLIDSALEWMRGRGMPRVLLWTAAPNATAQRVFERHGFRSTMIEMTRELS
jgi:ribosomal protein S18 acetylase RimI-like enzyme